MPNDFQQWVSLIANIATILGLVIAFTVWINWKKQQNYPFIRDKLSEQEQCLANLLLSIIVTMDDYLGLRKNELSAENGLKIEQARKNFELSYNTLKANNSKYDINHLLISTFAFKHISGYQIDRIHLEAIKFPSLRKRFDYFKNEVDKIESIEIIEEKCSIELEFMRQTIRDIIIVIITIRADL